MPSDVINAFCLGCHAIARSKGFYDEPSEFGTLMALVHSEVTESLEAHRNNEGDARIAEELADVCIRVFDVCGYLGLDLGQAIIAKMDKNRKRPQKHGKAY